MGIVRVAYGYGQSITKVFICIGYPIRRYRNRIEIESRQSWIFRLHKSRKNSTFSVEL